MKKMTQGTSPHVKRLLEALESWYGQDNEDWISLRRSEVGYILEELGMKER